MFNAIVNLVDVFRSPVIDVSFWVVATTVSNVVGKPSMPSDSVLVDCATSLDECPSDCMTLGNRCKVSKRSIALSSDAFIKSRPALTVLNATAPAEKFLMLAFSLSKPDALSLAFCELEAIVSFSLTKPLPDWLAVSLARRASSALTLKPLPPVLLITPASLTFSPACLKASPLFLVKAPASLTLKPAVLKSLPTLLALSPESLKLSPACFKPFADDFASVSRLFKSLDNLFNFCPLTWTSMTILPSAIYSSFPSKLYFL